MPRLLTGIDWLDSLRLHGRNRYDEIDRDNVESQSHAYRPHQARSPRMDGKLWDPEIPATQILDLEAGDREINQYKTHLATRSRSGNKPLETFVRSWSTWVTWNTHRKNKDLFSRQYIFSLIDFYPESGKWLFGGIFRVTERREDGYEVELEDLHRPLIGRLLIKFDKSFRTRHLKLEKYYDQFSVARILENVYEGRSFPGFQNIELTFPRLQNLVRTGRRDWRAALSSVKGVYLITDVSNGQKYVGSAYGDSGIWARWKVYAETGHGGDKELKKIIAEHGKQYAVENVKISLLEHHPMHKTKDDIIDRESYWKRILLSRDHGYNQN